MSGDMNFFFHKEKDYQETQKANYGPFHLYFMHICVFVYLCIVILRIKPRTSCKTCILSMSYLPRILCYWVEVRLLVVFLRFSPHHVLRDPGKAQDTLEGAWDCIQVSMFARQALYPLYYCSVFVFNKR